MHIDRLENLLITDQQCLTLYNTVINRGNPPLDYLPTEINEKITRLVPVLDLFALEAVFSSLKSPNHDQISENITQAGSKLPRPTRIVKTEIISALKGNNNQAIIEQFINNLKRNIELFFLNNSDSGVQGINNLLHQDEIGPLLTQMRASTLLNLWNSIYSESNPQPNLDPRQLFEESWEQQHNLINVAITKRNERTNALAESRQRYLFFKFLHERNNQRPLTSLELATREKERTSDALFIKQVEKERIATLQTQLDRHEKFHHRVPQIFPELAESSLSGAVLAQRLEFATNITEVFMLSKLLPPWVDKKHYQSVYRLLARHVPSIMRDHQIVDRSILDLSPPNQKYYSREEYINLYLGIIKLLTADANLPIDSHTPLGQLSSELNTLLSLELIDWADIPAKLQILDDFRQVIRIKSQPSFQGLNHLELLTQKVYNRPRPSLNYDFLQTIFLQTMFPEFISI